jgi:hypothetical protein
LLPLEDPVPAERERPRLGDERAEEERRRPPELLEEADEDELELEESESEPESELSLSEPPWLDSESDREAGRRPARLGLRDRERPARLLPCFGLERERSSRRLDLDSRDWLRSGISMGSSESTSTSDALAAGAPARPPDLLSCRRGPGSRPSTRRPPAGLFLVGVSPGAT